MGRTRNPFYNLILFISIIVAFLLSACENSSELKYLQGTWGLDSTSSAWSKEYDKNDSCNYLTFENETDYTYKTFCGCIHLDFKGKYFILNNPKRGLKTITLVPDVEVSEKDTIRIGYMNFDIVSINDDRLQIVYETEFINNENVHLRFNRNEIYKKLK